MLTSLRVKNLALVDNIRVEFKPGLNVITGETGAGKSIIIGALNLLLGDRADKGLIRSGEDACGAEAFFTLKDSSAIDEILEEFSLDPCEDGQLIIRRIVKTSGSTQNMVNDSPVTLQVLKRIGELLVDLHGPHDHQSLLSPEFQLDLLDAFGHLWTIRESYEHAYRELCELQQHKVELSGPEDGLAEQIDLLSYRAKEIEDAAPVEGEEEKIEQEHQIIGHAQRILELGNGIVEGMVDADTSVFNTLADTQKNLEELGRLVPEAEIWRIEVRELAARLQELNATMHRFLDHVEADPARLEWLDQRLATYQKLKRKYAPTVSELLEILKHTKQRLHDLQSRGEQLAAVNAEIEKVGKVVRSHGESLRGKRKAAAGKLAEAVTRELRMLGFQHGTFAVDLRDAEPRASGMDDIEFGFAPNVGEPMQPLRAIASSGEISRVMLAVKVVLAGHDRIPVLVFDEIDANVGGEMGSAIGRKLEEVARNHQVICVTHLPQVAVFGNHHLAVAKHVRNDRTFTEVQPLAETARVEEVARMLGGRDLTSVTLKHAREMLQKMG